MTESVRKFLVAVAAAAVCAAAALLAYDIVGKHGLPGSFAEALGLVSDGPAKPVDPWAGRGKPRIDRTIEGKIKWEKAPPPKPGKAIRVTPNGRIFVDGDPKPPEALVTGGDGITGVAAGELSGMESGNDSTRRAECYARCDGYKKRCKTLKCRNSWGNCYKACN